MIASENITEAIVYFSTGKDSIVTLDLCKKYIKNIKVINLYYNECQYRKDFIKYYEDRYGIEIIRRPHPYLARQYRENIYGCGYRDIPLMTLGEHDKYIKTEYNISYIAYGYKKTDSLSRRGMIYHGDGIDKRNKYLYPVADFNNKQIMKYIKDHKLKLAPEYKAGFRDMDNYFEKNCLLWLRTNYPDDFEIIKKQYPLIEAVFKKE
jgi:phosphoadenosine phosphosulfate reductase